MVCNFHRERVLHFEFSLSQFCRRSCPPLEGPRVWAVAMASLSGLHHRWLQRDGGAARASTNGGDWEREREKGDVKWKGVFFCVTVLSYGCFITAAVSIFTGGNGSVDRVPHFLLGRSDRTESQEDMWLVCEVKLNSIWTLCKNISCINIVFYMFHFIYIFVFLFLLFYKPVTCFGNLGKLCKCCETPVLDFFFFFK